VVWKTPLGARTFTTPIIANDGTILVLTREFLCKLSPEGKFLWDFGLVESPYGSGAILGDGSFVFATFDNAVHCVKADGSMKWTSKEVCALGSPVLGAGSMTLLSDSTFAFYANSDAIVCMNADGHLLDTISCSRSHGDFPVCSSTDGSLWFVRGLELVSSTLQEERVCYRWGLGEDSGMPGPIAYDSDRDRIVLQVGTSKLQAIRSSGELEWTRSLGVLMSGIAITVDGRIMLVASGSVICLESNGKIEWHHQLNSSMCTDLAIGSEGNVLVGSKRGILQCLSVDGTCCWQVDKCGFLVGGIALDGSGLAFLSNIAGELMCVG